MHLLVIGLWHQGVVGAACLAKLGHSVAACDADPARVAQLSTGATPVYEPGLQELISEQVHAGRLRWLSAPGDAPPPDVVLLMHDTPVNERDESDPACVLDSIGLFAPHLKQQTDVLVTAQVPVGTCQRLVESLRTIRPDWRGGLAYAPENLRLGQGIERFLNPPLPVMGADEQTVLDRLTALWPPEIRWDRVSLRTAEMVKHALNSFLATTITFANELGNLCDEIGADGQRIAEVLRREPRVGPKAMLVPGLGFAGGTLARDVQTLRAIGDRAGLDTPFLDGLMQANAAQNQIVLRKLRQAFGGSLAGRRIAILGLTYKPDTSTLRRSASVELAVALTREGAEVSAADPLADRTEVAALREIHFVEAPLEAVRDADAVVLMTPWPAYRALDLAVLRAVVRTPLLIDTAPLWKASDAEAAGWTYLDIGRGRKAGSCKS
ncbi:MAG TPA: nucleotide sugar dehydrogenase [Kiritimatiellia bacterium]|nr:nucleotide sugar dehydrogenase [Kiritimatiellia bacterium]